MTRDWPALAAAIKAVRTRLKMTQVQLATAAGTSPSTIQKLESGAGDKHWPNEPPEALPGVERILGWRDGTAVAILEEGAPAPPLPTRGRLRAARASDAESGGSALPDGMPLRVKSELAGGAGGRAVVEATVVQGPGDSRFVVVWTAGADVNADELTPQALEQWTRLNRAALGLPPGGDKADG